MKQFQKEVLFGRFFCSKSPDQNLNGIPHQQLSLRTSLKLEQTATSKYVSSTTGYQAPLDSGGLVTIIGRPYFCGANLSKVAQQENPACALAQAYSRSNHDFVKTLWGSFCFCIIDQQKDRIIVGTDRMGQHPMYYRTLDDGLAWCSSAEDLLRNTDTKPEVTAQGVYNYLYFHMTPSPTSVYADLKRLPAASHIIYEAGKSIVSKYWMPTFSETCSKSFEDTCDELKSTLRRAVERTLDNGASTGTFLSGGLDSSSVTGVFSEIADSKVKAFSIGFSADGYDEMEYARLAARHFNVELHEYYVTPDDVVEALPLIATSYDEPFGNSSALPAYFCAKLAAENGIDRLLAGDGGDEIFAGNERYVQQTVFERYKTIPSSLRKHFLEPILRAIPTQFPLTGKARSYVAQANTPLPDRLQSYNYLHRHSPESIFNTEFLAQVDTKAPISIQRHIFEEPQTASDLNRMLYLDWQVTLADNDLRKVNQTCSLAGVEVLYPMLDDELVSFACRIPGDWKIRKNKLRYFYKAALNNWLPDEIIHKRKQGFGLPFGVWMKDHKQLREMAYDNLLKLKNRHFFKPEFIDQTINMHESVHAAYYGELVWILTVFELWIDGHAETYNTHLN